MDANEPAFPASGYTGVTIREYIAIHAMAGLLADHVSRTDAVHFAVVAADLLIDELNHASKP